MINRTSVTLSISCLIERPLLVPSQINWATVTVRNGTNDSRVGGIVVMDIAVTGTAVEDDSVIASGFNVVCCGPAAV